MGNTQVFYYRLPALTTACCSSMALILLALSGTTCTFLEVVANPGKALATPQGIYISEDIGIMCKGDLYEIEGDSFWELSRIFLIISICLGSISTLISWLLATFVAPTSSRWKSMSILSALTAVLQVPIFLVFEAKPCSSFSGNQSCKISSGVFLLITSTVFWVVVTLLTQILDPPAWASELDAWRVEKSRQMPLVPTDSFDDGEGDEYLLLQRYANQTKPARLYSLLFGRIDEWVRKRRWASSETRELNLMESSKNMDEEEGGGGGWDTSKFQDGESYYAKSDNSRLMLKVTPDGKKLGDDQKSEATFGDLESIVHLAENGLLSPAPSVEIYEQGSLDDKSKLRGESISSLSSQEDQKSNGNTSKKILLNIAAKEKLLSPSQKFKAVPDSPFSASNEPQFYTDPKAFSNSSENGRALITHNATSSQTGCLDLGNVADESEVLNAAPAGKLALGIRALTIRIKRDAKRVKGGKGYEMMDDDDDASSLSSDGEYGDVEEGETSDTGAFPKKTAGSSIDGSVKRNLMKNWNSLFPAFSGDSSSEDEDEPEAVDYSSDETPLSVSINSLGHGSGRGEGSGSSRSDSSDSESNRRKRPSSRRRRRRGGSMSCGNSVASRTSVMTMTIDEETDHDLKEQESSGDDQTTVVSISPIKTPQSILAESLQASSHPPLLRTKSAPNLFRDTESDMPQDSAQPDADDFDTLSFSGIFGKGTMDFVQASAKWIRDPFGDTEATEQDNTQSAEWIRPSNAETDSDSEAEEKPAHNVSDSEQQASFSTETETKNDVESKEIEGSPATPSTHESEVTQTPSAVSSLLTSPPDLESDHVTKPPSAWVRTPDTDSESDDDTMDRKSPVTSVTASITEDGDARGSRRRKKRRSRSLCSPRARQLNCAHRYMEESIYQKGLHSPLIAVISDDGTDSSRSSDSSDANSVKSNKSRRARKARLRRLQRENEAGKRRRSSTLDPPKRRWSNKNRDIIEQAHEIIRMKSADVVIGSEEASL